MRFLRRFFYTQSTASSSFFALQTSLDLTLNHLSKQTKRLGSFSVTMTSSLSTSDEIGCYIGMFICIFLISPFPVYYIHKYWTLRYLPSIRKRQFRWSLTYALSCIIDAMVIRPVLLSIPLQAKTADHHTSS